MMKSRLDKGVAQILLLRYLCELETRFGVPMTFQGYCQMRNRASPLLFPSFSCHNKKEAGGGEKLT